MKWTRDITLLLAILAGGIAWGTMRTDVSHAEQVIGQIVEYQEKFNTTIQDLTVTLEKLSTIVDERIPKQPPTLRKRHRSRTVAPDGRNGHVDQQ